jgi:methylmalonyl-CoA mutase, C-terminal domain
MSSRFARPASKASIASSALRWPRVPPSGFVRRSVASQTNRSAFRAISARLSLGPESLVVEDPVSGHLEARRGERLALDVLVQVERLLEHLRLAEAAADRAQHLAALRRDPELRRLDALARPDRRPPDPRDEVAPVIEVPVRDRDRVEPRPRLALAELREHARAAVEQQPSRPLEQVARLGAAGIRPRRRAADDGEFHAHILVLVARKIRVVIAKPGLDGHDRGAKIIARALRDAGMEVIYTGLHQTPEQIVETAIQEDADAVGISILSGAHMTLVPRIIELLRENRVEDVVVVVGGTIPEDDAEELRKLGVAGVFGPGAPTTEIVDFIRGAVPA